MRLCRRCLCHHGLLAALVAAYTVVHAESIKRRGRRLGQSLHRPMTGLALYFRHDNVGAMWKEHMGRQTPYAPPGNLLALFPVGSQLFYFRALMATGAG